MSDRCPFCGGPAGDRYGATIGPIDPCGPVLVLHGNWTWFCIVAERSARSYRRRWYPPSSSKPVPVSTQKPLTDERTDLRGGGCCNQTEETFPYSSGKSESIEEAPGTGEEGQP